MTKLAGEQSLLKLLMPIAILVLALVFIIGIAFGSQFQMANALSADSLSSWVSSISTVVIAVLTCVLAKETWHLRAAQIEQVNELRRESLRPNVFVTLKSSRVDMNFMTVEVRNLGKGIAKNIRFEFVDKQDKQIKQPENIVVEEFLKLHVFSSGIHTMGIRQKIESYLFSFIELSTKLGSEVMFSEYFRILVSYEDVEGTQYRNELIVDFNEYRGISEIGGGDPLYKIANDVKRLSDQFEQIANSSSKRLHVNTYSSEDREAEKAQRATNIKARTNSEQ